MAILISSILIALLTSAFQAGVLSVLWLWFVTPLGVPGIGLIQAWGITLLVTLLVFDPSINRDTEGLANVFAKGMVAVFALIVGAILQAFM